MGILSKLFGKPKSITSQAPMQVANEECKQLLRLKSLIQLILGETHYVPRSEYIHKIEEFKKTIEYFSVLDNSGMLGSFCAQNGIKADETKTLIKQFNSIIELVGEANERYIRTQLKEEKAYLDNVLKAVDPKVTLDDDQRRVVLTDEDYCLVIAGAGAGKTTTVAAKVKYLVEKKGVDPSQILVVSFTNKAVNELKEKIQDALGVPCPIATFHSTGNAIIHKNSPDEKLNIVDNSKLYFVIRDYFRGSILQNESVVNKLIMFFASYFDAPYEGDDLNGFFNNIAKSNFSTMRSDLEDFRREVIDARTKKSVTIQNEILRSHQEVEIANFLYLNNIDYEYEPIYKYDIEYSHKPYTPDFVIKQGENVIYIEHFGLTEDGQNDRYNQDEIEQYKKAAKDKVLLHRQHGTQLIYTYSAYKDKRPITIHLKEALEAKGIELKPRSNKEVMEMLVAGEENRYVRKLINLICRFISNFKVNGYNADEFNRMYHSTQNVRSRLFLDICHDCYLEYDRWLKENNAVDFEDMINESARLLREVKEMKQKLDFKYVIVDEYQDISRQRFDLTRALADVTDAKIIAVGDDWQSIYAFSGSDITLFTKFEEKMGYAKLLKIVKTYRNSQDVIDIAGNFIQKNTEQIEKRLISPKTITDPVIIYTYDSTSKGPNGDRRSGANYALALAVETALEQLIAYKKQEGIRNGYFIGCTNYKENGTGCNKSMGQKYYYDQMGYKYELEEAEVQESQQANQEKTGYANQADLTGKTLSEAQPNIVPTEDMVDIVKADLPEIVYSAWNLNDVLYNILNALQNVSKVRYYGISMLVDILRGADNKRIFDNKLDKIPEFGLYKEMPRETIQSIIEWMIKEKLILKTKERYPVLHSTDEGLHYNEHVTVNKLRQLKKYLEEEVVLWK